MRRAHRVAAVAAALGLAGCGGGGGPALVCGVKELRASGTLDGQPVEIVQAVQTYQFANQFGMTDGIVEASGGQVSLSLDFDKLIIDGGSGAARGFLVDAASGLSVGNCDTGGFVSTLTVDGDGDGVHFTLRQLHRAPYCTGAAVTGELAGCLGFQPFQPL